MASIDSTAKGSVEASVANGVDSKAVWENWAKGSWITPPCTPNRNEECHHIQQGYGFDSYLVAFADNISAWRKRRKRPIIESFDNIIVGVFGISTGIVSSAVEEMFHEDKRDRGMCPRWNINGLCTWVISTGFGQTWWSSGIQNSVIKSTTWSWWETGGRDSPPLLTGALGGSWNTGVVKCVFGYINNYGSSEGESIAVFGWKG